MWVGRSQRNFEKNNFLSFIIIRKVYTAAIENCVGEPDFSVILLFTLGTYNLARMVFFY